MTLFERFWNKINKQKNPTNFITNLDKAKQDLNNFSSKEIAIENAQSWEPETGHTNGPEDSFCVKSFHWKDGVFDIVYRNGNERSGTCTDKQAQDFVTSSSKGRAQRTL